MKLFNLILLASAIISLGSTARQPQNIAHDVADIRTGHTCDDKCRQYDSLGNVSLQAGDTSLALYYYDELLTLHPQDESLIKLVSKCRKVYNEHGRSFYLQMNPSF